MQKIKDILFLILGISLTILVVIIAIPLLLIVGIFYLCIRLIKSMKGEVYERSLKVR